MAMDSREELIIQSCNFFHLVQQKARQLSTTEGEAILRVLRGLFDAAVTLSPSLKNPCTMITLTVEVPQSGPELQGKNLAPFGVFLDTFEMNMRYGPVYTPDEPSGNLSTIWCIPPPSMDEDEGIVLFNVVASKAKPSVDYDKQGSIVFGDTEEALVIYRKKDPLSEKYAMYISNEKGTDQYLVPVTEVKDRQDDPSRMIVTAQFSELRSDANNVYIWTINL